MYLKIQNLSTLTSLGLLLRDFIVIEKSIEYQCGKSWSEMKSVGLACSRENEMSSLCIWNINLEIGYKKSPTLLQQYKFSFLFYKAPEFTDKANLRLDTNIDLLVK